MVSREYFKYVRLAIVILGGGLARNAYFVDIVRETLGKILFKKNLNSPGKSGES